MDPRFIIIVAALFVAAAGYICLAPDQVPFLRLPQVFLQLGMERTVTGLALMLLGFLVALSETGVEERPRRTRRVEPFAFGGETLAPEAGELRLDPEPEAPPPLRRRPDLYESVEPQEPAAAVPISNSPPPPEP